MMYDEAQWYLRIKFPRDSDLFHILLVLPTKFAVFSLHPPRLGTDRPIGLLLMKPGLAKPTVYRGKKTSDIMAMELHSLPSAQPASLHISEGECNSLIC